VIFLDLPRVVCIYRILKRVARHYGRNRPDMAADCNEQFDWKFIQWVWNFPTRSKPRVEALLNEVENDKTIVRLRSPAEVKKFLMSLEANRVKFV
jgi:adenylate kinase family enzyme